MCVCVCMCVCVVVKVSISLDCYLHSLYPHEKAYNSKHKHIYYSISVLDSCLHLSSLAMPRKQRNLTLCSLMVLSDCVCR